MEVPPTGAHRSRPGRSGPSRRAILGGVAGGIAAAAAGYAVAGRGGHGGPALSLYGAPDSFGDLTASRALAIVGVPGWGFGPGQAAYMSAVASDGTVFIATTPFSDDQSRPTGTDMELAVFEPASGRFTRLVVASSTGRQSEPAASAALHGIGGGDVSDVVVVPGPDGGERVVFTSASPYFGWDIATYGTLPTIGQLHRADGRWGYDEAASRDADRLAASAGEAPAAVAFPPSAPGRPRSSRGAAAIARLPRSGHLVVAQYFGTGVTAGGTGGGAPEATDSGALLVVDVAGTVRASWQYPAVSVFGGPVVVNPREVVADPSSAAGDERFVVVLDARTADGSVVPFPVQEFSYAAAGGVIAPRSTAVRAAQDGSRMETACFGADGTLYVARTAGDGLSAAPLAVYPKVGGERGLVRRAPAVAGWPGTAWGATCAPDHLVGAVARGGLVRSIGLDPATGTVLLVGLSGLVQALRPAGRGASMTFEVPRGLDLGLNGLRGPATHFVGVRRGCVDADRRALWVPANQLVLDDIAWPYPPFKLDQWLYRVDLRRLLAG
jgi:hypothetical protein